MWSRLLLQALHCSVGSGQVELLQVDDVGKRKVDVGKGLFDAVVAAAPRAVAFIVVLVVVMAAPAVVKRGGWALGS